MGFMQNQSLDISEIMTETSTEPSPIIFEDDDKEVLYKQEGEVNEENIEKRFITSPADIEVHRKVELQDADITEAQQNAFKDLCTEFNDIFSTDSGDIGKTPLLEVEIDTGNSLPITQKPYTLPLNHTCMGTKRTRNIGESWSNSEKCLTLGQSHSCSSKKNCPRGTP